MSGKAIQFSTPELAGLTEEESATGKALSPEQLQQVSEGLKELMDWRVASTVAQDTERAYRLLDKALQ